MVSGERIHVTTRPVYTDYRSQVMFFCGNEPDCIAFNSKSAMNRAKMVAEQEYAVVGVLEQLGDTFKVLQKFIPRFFSNSTKVYELMKEPEKRKNYNPNKREISSEVRQLMLDKFSNEIEFYQFCRQRLHKQLFFPSENNNANVIQMSSTQFFDSQRFVLL